VTEVVDAERMSAVLQAGLAVASDLDLDAVLARLLDSARSLTGARYAALGVLDESGRELSQLVTSGIDERTRAQIGRLPHGRGLLGELLRSPQPLRLADIAGDPRSVGVPPNHPPMRSFLGVPVMVGDQLFGNLYLTEAAAGEFGPGDEAVALMLAAQAGAAVRNAHLYRKATEHAEALERALRELSSVRAINDAILDERPRDELLALIADRALEGVAAATVGVALATPAGDELEYVAVAGAGAERLRGVRLTVAGTAAGQAMAARRSLRTGTAAAADAFGEPAVLQRDVQVILLVPLLLRGEAIGALAAFDPRGDGADGDDLHGLELFAARAVLALAVTRALAGERARGEAELRLAAAEERVRSRREMLARVVEAQERERRRIARELHDDAGQALASVTLGLQLVERKGVSDDARRLLTDLRATVERAISDLRSLAVELRPSALDDYGLAPALERLCEGFSRRTGIAVERELDPLAARMSEPVETAVYRIVQESLTNVAKHAAATTVRVVASREGERTTITISDDGRGFTPAAGAGGGIGLDSMRERAELVAGTLVVSSRPGAGTRVSVEI